MGIPIWWEKQNPRTILQPGSSPGQCWAFKGSQGSVVIKLSNPIQISEVTLEHIPKTLSPDGNVASAPKFFEVYGLERVEDDLTKNAVLLGNFTYDTENIKNPVQTFKVLEEEANNKKASFNLVEFKFLANHGHLEYTCIYRVRVHGNLDETTNDPKTV
jgi:SUN domain-containing protein 1/2